MATFTNSNKTSTTFKNKIKLYNGIKTIDDLKDYTIEELSSYTIQSLTQKISFTNSNKTSTTFSNLSK